LLTRRCALHVKGAERAVWVYYGGIGAVLHDAVQFPAADDKCTVVGCRLRVNLCEIMHNI